MLQELINTAADEFIKQLQSRQDERGQRLVVKNGSLPTRVILTGARAIEVAQGRARYNSPNRDDRGHFTCRIYGRHCRWKESIDCRSGWLS